MFATPADEKRSPPPPSNLYRDRIIDLCRRRPIATNPMCRFYGFNDHRARSRFPAFPPPFPLHCFFSTNGPGRRNGFGWLVAIYLPSVLEIREHRVINLDLEIWSSPRANQMPRLDARLATIGQCPVLF